MPITHFVAHRIYSADDSSLKTAINKEELSVNDQLESFTADLKQAYMNRINREHGKFGKEEGEQGILADLLEGSAQEKHSFLQLSEAVVNGLTQALDGEEVDGHVICFQETIFTNEYFYLFLVKQKEISAISSNLEVETIYSVDLGPSLVVAKVDISEWKKDDGTAYLTITVPRANKPFLEKFISLVGFSNGLNKVEGTKAFLETIETFSKNVPEEQVATYRTQVVDYCVEQEKMDTPVELTGLSQSVEGIDTNAFSRYLADNLPGAEQPLRMDQKSLRDYVKFAGREKDLALSFSSYQLNKRIKYDANTDTLSISGLPKTLRGQLLRHLKIEE